MLGLKLSNVSRRCPREINQIIYLNGEFVWNAAWCNREIFETLTRFVVSSVTLTLSTYSLMWDTLGGHMDTSIDTYRRSTQTIPEQAWRPWRHEQMLPVGSWRNYRPALANLWPKKDNVLDHYAQQSDNKAWLFQLFLKKLRMGCKTISPLV